MCAEISETTKATILGLGMLGYWDVACRFPSF